LGQTHSSDPVFVLHGVAAFPTLSHVKRRYIESRAAASLQPTTPTDACEPNEHQVYHDKISSKDTSKFTSDSTTTAFELKHASSNA
jgi:hypothetical protein